MRRMLLPEVKIKSKIVDDKNVIDFSELEPYVENGIVIVQVIASDLPNFNSNSKDNYVFLQDRVVEIGYFTTIGAIITLKINEEGVLVFGDFYDNDDDGNPYNFLYFNGRVLGDLYIGSPVDIVFDCYVIKN